MEISLVKRVVSPSDALDKYSQNIVTTSPNRTTLFGVYNNTPIGIEIGFGQIKSAYTGAGYIGDTGVFTFASSGAGSKPALFDPLNYGWKIAGTWGEMAIKIGGQDIKDQYPAITEEGRYYSQITWRIGVSAAGDGISIEQTIVLGKLDIE